MEQPDSSPLHPRPLGPGWWLVQLAGLVVATGLMGVLAFALMVLTRMPVEQTTTPEAHLPTFVVWFVLCTATIVGSMGVSTWRELKDERVHVDLSGAELRIDRWSPPDERRRFVDQVTADERARARAGERRDVDEAPRAATTQEPRAAGRSSRDVGPGRRSGEPTGPLRLAAVICFYAWVPLSVVSAVVLVELQDTIDPGWGMLALLLLPIGWVLMEIHLVLRHRSQRTRHSRSDLAQWQGVTAFVVAVLLVLVAFTGLVMRDEYLGVALIGFPLAVLCGWIAVREMAHHIPRRSKGNDQHYSPPDLNWMM